MKKADRERLRKIVSRLKKNEPKFENGVKDELRNM